MEELLEKLNQFWSAHEAIYDEDGLSFFETSTFDRQEVTELMNLIWDHLFIGSGYNYETKEFLIENGYSVRTFERDSFGLLVIGIGKDYKWLSIG